MRFQRIVTSVLLTCVVFMSGCSKKEAGVATNTGFFENYTQKTPLKLRYTKIKVAPVQVISGLAQESESQKKMYGEISRYLTTKYKEIVKNNPRYSLSDVKAKDTLVLQSAISTVEVHYDDPKWKQHTPIAMGLDSISFNAYMYEFVRVLGKSKLSDSMSKTVISRTMKIQDKHIIKIDGDDLVFNDIKPALDSWLVQVKDDLSSK